MSDAKTLLQKRQAQRETTVPLDGDKKVRVRRPLETDVVRLSRMDPLDVAIRYAVGWEGFSEADILQSGAADQPVEFDSDLFRDIVGDRLDWVVKIDQAISEQIRRYAEQRQAAAGNSLPTSS